MKKIRILILAVSFGALLSPAAYSWDDTGHQLSAMIAWEVMTPAARERAIQILLAAPEDSHLSVHFNAFSSRSDAVRKLELFMFASTWPDVVRNRAFENRYLKYHKSNWHYADIFWEGDGKMLKDFPEPSGVAIRKLSEFESALGSAQVSDEDKAIALAWFLHVASDIHNPLHNASRVTLTEAKGDQGGNLFYLEPAKPDGSWRLNLHSFWDGQITRGVPRANDSSDADYLRPIAKMSFAMFGAEHFKERLKLSDYAAWNAEGFAFLAPKVYKDLARDSLPDEAYSNRAFALSFEQISLAGHRIGNTLNSALDPKVAVVRMFDGVTGCKIIRKVPYPVSKRAKLDSRPVIALLDICPADRGMVARPTISLDEKGSSAGYEYDVLMVFEDRDAAARYAGANHIEDVRIDRR